MFVMRSKYVTCPLNAFVRQNRKERLIQKKWSHIDPQLIGPLDEKEVSLKVNCLHLLRPLTTYKLIINDPLL